MMRFDRQEIEDVRAVFGDEGATMAEKLEYDVGDVSRVVKDDYGNVSMELGVEDMGNPFVRIHEFAHYYHCKLFPDLSEMCVPYRAEAVAALVENRLSEKRIIPDDWIGLRIMHWQDVLSSRKDLYPLLNVVNLVFQLPGGDIRDTIEGILRGDFG